MNTKTNCKKFLFKPTKIDIQVAINKLATGVLENQEIY